MPSPAEFSGYFADIHFAKPAPGDQANPVTHLRESEKHIDVFHVPELMDQHRKVVYILV
jgi:hypothetical protein